MKKRFAVISVLCFLIFNVMQFPTWADSVSSGSFAFQIVPPDHDQIDLSGIELMIYAEQSTTEYEDGVTAIDEEYSYSVYTNSNGLARFDPPEHSFSVNVNLSSIPKGWGAVTYTRHFSNTSKFGQIAIRRIADAEIVENQNQYTVVAYDEYGLPLVVDSEVVSTLSVGSANLNTNKFTDYRKLNTINCTLSAQVGDISLKKQVSESIRGLSAIEKCRYLYSISLIDQSQYIKLLCEAVRSDCGIECGTSIIGEIQAYAQTMTKDDPNYDIISSASVQMISPPAYSTEYTYPSSSDPEYSSARFVVHYGTVKSTGVSVGSREIAKKIYNEIVHIDSFMCNGLLLTKPQGAIHDNKYDLYIVDALSGDADTPPSGRKSYIRIKSSYAENITKDNNTANSFSGSLAHEYMHACMFAYGIEYSSQNSDQYDMWFHECMGSFMGVIYSAARDYSSYSAFINAFKASSSSRFDSIYASNRKTAAVKDFIKSMYKSITDNIDDGAILLPLYICDYKNDIDFIGTILSYYTQYHDPIFLINEKILSITNNFAGFCAACYHPRSSFKVYGNAWPDSIVLESQDQIQTYPHTTLRHTSNHLSCKYLDYIAPTRDQYTLSVTTTLYGYTAGSPIPASIIMYYRENANSSYRGSNTRMRTTQTVVTMKGFGSTYSKVAVGFANCSMNQSITYYQKASITNTVTSTTFYVKSFENSVNPLKQIGLL